MSHSGYPVYPVVSSMKNAIAMDCICVAYPGGERTVKVTRLVTIVQFTVMVYVV